jgi:hypothetical protein
MKTGTNAGTGTNEVLISRVSSSPVMTHSVFVNISKQLLATKSFAAKNEKRASYRGHTMLLA